MRVAVLLDTFLPASETFILRQITGLMKRGAEVDIFALAPADPASTHREAIRALGDRVRYLNGPTRRSRRAFKALRVAGALGRRRPLVLARSLNVARYRRAALSLLYAAAGVAETGGRYDVVHCEFGHLGIIGLRLQQVGVLSGKLVTSFRGNDSTGFLRAHPGVYRELFAQGDLFCPVSESLKQRIVAAGCPAERTVVVHSGIDLTTIPYRPTARQADEPTKVLAIGRLVEKKGIEYAIRAVGHLVRSGRQVHLTVAGDGPLGPVLAQLIASEGLGDHVRMIGWVDDAQVPGLLREAHILVAPSVTAASGDTEGIPNVLKEAMAAGLPVVSTRHGGVPELVEDGVSGLLAPEKDAAALADRLAYLIDHPDLWARFAQAARRKVEAEFDIEVLNDKLLGLYRGLTKDPAGREGPEPVRARQVF